MFDNLMNSEIICLNSVRYIKRNSNKILFLDFYLKIEYVVDIYIYSNKKHDINIIKNSEEYKNNIIKTALIFPLNVEMINIVNKLDKSDYDYIFSKNFIMFRSQKSLRFKEVYILPYHIIFIFNNYLTILPNYYEKIPNDKDFSNYLNSAIKKSNFFEIFLV